MISPIVVLPTPICPSINITGSFPPVSFRVATALHLGANGKTEHPRGIRHVVRDVESHCRNRNLSDVYAKPATGAIKRLWRENVRVIRPQFPVVREDQRPPIRAHD